jgi:hypothetical protein
MMIVYCGLDACQPGERPFVDHEVVQHGLRRERFPSPADRDEETHSKLGAELPRKYRFYDGKKVFLGDFGEKTDFSEFDPEDRNIEISDPSDRTQKRSIPADDKNTIEVFRRSTGSFRALSGRGDETFPSQHLGPFPAKPYFELIRFFFRFRIPLYDKTDLFQYQTPALFIVRLERPRPMDRWNRIDVKEKARPSETRNSTNKRRQRQAISGTAPG